MFRTLTERQFADLIHAALEAAGHHYSDTSRRSPQYTLALVRRPGDDTPVCEVSHVPYWQGDLLAYARQYADILRADPMLAGARIEVVHHPKPCVRVTYRAEQA